MWGHYFNMIHGLANLGFTIHEIFFMTNNVKINKLGNHHHHHDTSIAQTTHYKNKRLCISTYVPWPPLMYVYIHICTKKSSPRI